MPDLPDEDEDYLQSFRDALDRRFVADAMDAIEALSAEFPLCDFLLSWLPETGFPCVLVRQEGGSRNEKGVCPIYPGQPRHYIESRARLAARGKVMNDDGA